MRAIGSDLNNAADPNHCWRCAMRSAAGNLAAATRDLKAAKKSGQWSKEEKKAVKAEVKELFKEIKRDMKKERKAKSQA